MILNKEFFQVQNAVFDNPDLGLNRNEKIVFLYLSRCSNQCANAFPAYETIAKSCSMSRQTAIKAVKSLSSRILPDGKPFIIVTRRPKGNRDNESNLYQVNLLPSKSRTPPLVKQGDQSSTQGIPYKEPIIKNHCINKGTTINGINEVKTTVEEGTDIISIKENVYPSGKSAFNGLTSLTDKDTEKNPNPPVPPTPLPLTKQTPGDTIEEYIRIHGSLDMCDVPLDWDFRGSSILLNTLRNDPRLFEIKGRVYMKDNIPQTVRQQHGGSPALKT